MTLKIGTKVMALQDYFPPSQTSGLEYWPLAGEMGRVICAEGDIDGVRLYGVRFEDDEEADLDNATWTYAESELEVVS